MLDYAAAILALLPDWIAKGFVVLGLAFLADLLLRRADVSLRHLIWLVGLAGQLPEKLTSAHGCLRLFPPTKRCAGRL